MVEVFDVLGKLYGDYQRTTPKRLKLIDAYMFYILLTGIIQFVYCLLVGTFPFNAFLAGFISCVASFVLAGLLTLQICINFMRLFAANLRIQVNPENKVDFPNIRFLPFFYCISVKMNILFSPERAFADFIFAHVILHLVVVNFIG
jgi:oligosaccharyltransferase complex subunit epsilon